MRDFYWFLTVVIITAHLLFIDYRISHIKDNVGYSAGYREATNQFGRTLVEELPEGVSTTTIEIDTHRNDGLNLASIDFPDKKWLTITFEN